MQQALALILISTYLNALGVGFSFYEEAFGVLSRSMVRPMLLAGTLLGG